MRIRLFSGKCARSSYLQFPGNNLQSCGLYVHRSGYVGQRYYLIRSGIIVINLYYHKSVLAANISRRLAKQKLFLWRAARKLTQFVKSFSREAYRLEHLSTDDLSASYFKIPVRPLIIINVFCTLFSSFCFLVINTAGWLLCIEEYVRWTQLLCPFG